MQTSTSTSATAAATETPTMIRVVLSATGLATVVVVVTEKLHKSKVKKGKVLIIYIAVLRNLGLLQDRFNNTPLDHWAHTRQLQAAPKHMNPHKVPNYCLVNRGTLV